MIEFLKFLSGWLIWLFAIGCLMSLFTRGWLRGFSIFFTLMIAVPAYAHLIEPRILRVKTVDLTLPGAPAENGESLRLLLLADIHHNDHDYSMSVERVVREAKKLEFDAVLIAGDLVRSLQPEGISKTFEALGTFKKPVYVVLGNHDVGRPGQDLGLELTTYLNSLPNVHLLNNRTAILTVNGRDVWITGTSDLWERRIVYPTDNPPPGVPRLILTHNPDVAFDVPPDVEWDLMLSGHTHGGQVRIPTVYEHYIPTDYPFDINLHRVNVQSGEKQVWVTSGIGMSGLTMRFLIPPRLDLLTLHLPPQPSTDETD
ncbi:MAG: hypothetical protein CMK09_16950 [Ponticaulis sp.]|nr:hypothetical protein [Ponticaulis sp.]|tara:strand:- start:21314 stop:22255 length:942 start_codon:yes stop_codon:yes gene_type:complete